MYIVKKIKIILMLILFVMSTIASANEFVVKKIQFVGLQHIALGTALSYLPVKEGDRIDSAQMPDIIRALYKTGFFSDVAVTQDKGTLKITVQERAIIGTLNISGNRKLTTKQLKEALKSAGLVEGQAFDRSILNSVEQALVQQYYNLGIYNAKVQASVQAADRNRVTVNIRIVEGNVAKIQSIRIIGNHAFSERALLKNFTLSTSNIFTLFSHDDQYSKEKLDADLEKLRSYYLDRGYIRFKIDATQVSITPDKKHIYIVIHITEGSIYTIKECILSGNLLNQGDKFLKLITLKPGDAFSRKKIIEVEESLNNFIGDLGFGKPDIRIDPIINDQTKQVTLKFNIDPGKRIYVRRINFSGNDKTHDYVLRREMRLQEGGLFSISKINESKRRLANLGYLEGIDDKVVPVPGHPELVDLNFNVKEASAITANFQVGYSDTDGLLYGVNLNDKNFLGTGKMVSIGFNNSKDLQNYSFTYYNPYYTQNQISMSITGYIQKSMPDEIGLTSYTANIYGLGVRYGVPFSEYNTLFFGYGYEHTDIGTNILSSTQVKDFTNKYGSSYNELKLTTAWSYYNLDRAIFPTEGFQNSLDLEFAVPLGKQSVQYYKADYSLGLYYPLIKNFIFHARGDLGYGNGYGNTLALPFFKNFFVGGIDSVRGFYAGSLGPLDSYGKAMGGNLATVASGSIIFPNPLGDSLRTSVFVDIGNVYQNKFISKDLRSSYGIGVEWRSPLGPLVFCFAKPISTKSGDNLDSFEFNVGTSF
ncbi:MAG: outer membrane protein assembly factor BamA [Gammaproteobacteria bacterium]|nr:outer membrane protein assembly factor BamA [Gammaproteobacteria bacterium]